jgi:hypothetical protein
MLHSNFIYVYITIFAIYIIKLSFVSQDMKICQHVELYKCTMFVPDVSVVVLDHHID